jgi:superfamily II DNA or RNA helicase
MNRFYPITPEYLTEYISFKYKEPKWIYGTDKTDTMEKLQAQGTAKVWNLLLEQKIALLADEVGMGKTLQALGAIVTLWRQKPDAKILLYAPNQNVAKKWVKEYNNFIRYHYKINDDLVKSSLTKEVLHEAIYCDGHHELLLNAAKTWPALFVCKTSTLSNFHSEKLSNELLANLGFKLKRPIRLFEEPDEVQTEWMKEMARESKEKLKSFFGRTDSPFDLIIVDEAHFLRRTEDSTVTNKSKVANEFFKGSYPIADMTLLMTATPNHTSSQDICNIVQLFQPTLGKLQPPEILEKICVRRLRTLQGKTKHEYRDEILDPTKMQTLRQKLFFTAYQKSLILHQSTENETKTNPYRLIFGYLEGFEFISDAKSRKELKGSIKAPSENNSDFIKSDDSQVILELSEKYLQAYSSNPDHPKYDRLRKELSPEERLLYNNKEKAVVFVRRIPSVYEITRRVMEAYDVWFLNVLQKISGKNNWKSLRLNQNLREIFAAEIPRSDKNEEFDPEFLKKTATDQPEKESNELKISGSIILDLFTVKKKSSSSTIIERTDCSNFRLRFLRTDQIFCLFFQPAADYKKKQYSLKVKYISNKSGKKRTDYETSAQIERWNCSAVNKEKFLLSINFNQFEKSHDESGEQDFETLLSIWWNLEPKDPLVQKKQGEAKCAYEKFKPIEKEGLSKYLEKGTLFSSPYIVFLYAIFKKTQNWGKPRGDVLYKKFCIEVNQKMESIGLADLISEAILSFRFFYEKELGIKEETLMDEPFAIFNFTIPIYPYCGETKRGSIIKAFNTPFYPNTLVATSVLQEGVDLHYHCNKVIHYGLAMTYGDNEQRVGRVDRMFGLQDRLLKESDKATLPIKYPYLESSLDEDQLKRFTIRKFNSELLLDNLTDLQFDKEINILEGIRNHDWKQFLRKPKPKDGPVNEPFGVKSDSFLDIVNIQPILNKNTSKLINTIINSLKSKYGGQLLVLSNKQGDETDAEFAALKFSFGDSKKGRHQPVLFEIKYFEEGFYMTGKPVYILIAKTPLDYNLDAYSNYAKFGNLKDVYFNKPNIKICHDSSQLTSKRNKHSFKLYCRIELPLIIESESIDLFNVSRNELIYHIEELINFTDDLEYKISGKDIKNEKIIPEKFILEQGTYDSVLSLDRAFEKRWYGWRFSADQKMAYREKQCNITTKIESYNLNHKFYLRRFLLTSSGGTVQTSIYKPDALQSEIELISQLDLNHENLQ